MTLASMALLALVGAFTVEAAHGPMRASQPFGLVAPTAAFRAASMPAVNGRASATPVQDRNVVVLSGVGMRR